MKKIAILLLSACLAVGTIACAKPQEQSGNPSSDPASAALETSDDKGPSTIRIGVSPSPHAEIVEQIKKDLADEGITLEVVTFNDYIVPNKALADKSIDANYFQHIPYFESFTKENGLDLEILGGIHIEPMGIFSKKYKSLDELKENDEVMFPNDPTNGGRALLLLQSKGLIKLKDGGSVSSTEADIVENPKKLKFTALEAALLPTAYADAGIAVINGNYAIQNGLNPVTDSLAIEGSDSPYVNVVAVRKGDAKKENYQKLLKALQSDTVKHFIEDQYKGSVVPAFTTP